MEFVVREGARRDYDALCRLFAESDALHREALPGVFRTPRGRARSKAFLRSFLSGEEAALFVAERDGELIGLVCVCLREAPDFPILVRRRYGVIGDLVVAEPFRLRGVGRSLIEHAHGWLAARGIAEVELHVWEFNREAIIFYEKLGYATASRKMWRRIPAGGGPGG